MAMMCTMPPPDLDRLVARAQRGDAVALEALCARVRPMLVRHARRLLGRSAEVELADRALVSDHDAMTEAEWRLVEQDLHLACTVGVLTGLSPDARRLYLLGEVLAVPDRVGAQVAQVTPAAYRKRLERARRAVAQAVRERPHGGGHDERVAVA